MPQFMVCRRDSRYRLAGR